MGLDLTNLSPQLRARLLRDNPEEGARLGLGDAGNAGWPLMRLPADLAAARRLNDTERAYLFWARALPDTDVWAQCIGLRLSGLGGDRVFYYPDFCLLDATGLRFVDTKPLWSNGKPHMTDDARVKICFAAQVFSPIPFFIAWRQNGVWHHRRMSPGTKL